MDCRNEGPVTHGRPSDATASQRHELERAAADRNLPPHTCVTAATLAIPGFREGDDGLWERSRQIDAISTTTFATLSLAVMGLWLWHLMDPTPAVAPAAATLALTRPVAAAVAQTSVPAPVAFVNPFDPTEIFELPSGTTQDAAREIVASLLLDRAQSRISDGTMFRVAAGRQAKQFAAR